MNNNSFFGDPKMNIDKLLGITLVFFTGFFPFVAYPDCNESDIRMFRSGASVSVLWNPRSFEDSNFTPESIAQVENTILDAMQSWNSVGADLLLNFAGTTNATRPRGNEILIMGIARGWDNTRGNATMEPGSSRIQIHRSNEDEGEIDWTSRVLRSVIIHEVGHSLGLNHNRCGYYSIMYPTGSARGVRPILADIDDLKALYGTRRYAFTPHRLEDTLRSWTALPSNLHDLSNVFTSYPFTVIADGKTVADRQRVLFYIDKDNHPAYLVSDYDADGTVSNNFKVNGYIFNTSRSITGTGGATDGKGEYMLAWVDQDMSNNARVTLRVRHNEHNLNQNVWVDVDPGLVTNIAKGKPTLAHIRADTWLIVFPTTTGVAYLFTHDDGDTWETIQDKQSGVLLPKWLSFDSKNLQTASASVDVVVRNEGQQVEIAFPKFDLPSESELLPQNYRPLTVHAHVDGSELKVDSISYRDDDLVRSHFNLVTNDSLFVQAYNIVTRNIIYFRSTDDLSTKSGWSGLGATVSSQMVPELASNTGLSLSDCSSSDWVCQNEASKANNIFLFKLEDKGSYAPAPGQPVASFSPIKTIERDPLGDFANADYRIIPRPKAEWPTGGICADIVVTNNGEAPVDPWKIVMEGIPGKIYDFWNVEWQQVGSTVVAQPRSDVNWPNCCYLVPGEATSSTDFGFCSSSNQDPDSTIPTPLPGEVVSTHIYDRFNGGYCSYLTVQNSGNERVAWHIYFYALGNVNVWNMQITGEEPADQNGFRKFTAKGVNWNAYLDPGESTHDIGFCVQNGLSKSDQPR